MEIETRCVQTLLSLLKQLNRKLDVRPASERRAPFSGGVRCGNLQLAKTKKLISFVILRSRQRLTLCPKGMDLWFGALSICAQGKYAGKQRSVFCSLRLLRKMQGVSSKMWGLHRRTGGCCGRLRFLITRILEPIIGSGLLSQLLGSRHALPLTKARKAPRMKVSRRPVRR